MEDNDGCDLTFHRPENWIVPDTFSMFEVACLISSLDPNLVKVVIDAERTNIDPSDPNETLEIPLLAGAFAENSELLRRAISCGALPIIPEYVGMILTSDLIIWMEGKYSTIPDWLVSEPLPIQEELRRLRRENESLIGRRDALAQLGAYRTELLDALNAAIAHFWAALPEGAQGPSKEEVKKWLNSEYGIAAQGKGGAADCIDKIIRRDDAKAGRRRSQ
jgi:hypothetical protein